MRLNLITEMKLEDEGMVPTRNHWKLRVAVVMAGLGALVGLAQQPRRVTEDLLKTGSKTGDESVAGGGRGDGGAAGGANAAPRPANLLVLALDGKAPIPGTTPPGN